MPFGERPALDEAVVEIGEDLGPHAPGGDDQRRLGHLAEDVGQALVVQGHQQAAHDAHDDPPAQVGLLFVAHRPLALHASHVMAVPPVHKRGKLRYRSPLQIRRGRRRGS